MADAYNDWSSDRDRDREWQESRGEDGSRDEYGSHGDDRPRGHVFIAWFVILSLIGVLFWLRDNAADQQPKPHPLDDSPVSTRGLMELQTRALIGLGELLRQTNAGADGEVKKLFEGDPADPQDQAQHAAMWSRGTLGQRLQYVITGGELSGPEAALKLLGQIKWDLEATKLKPSAEQLAVLTTLRKIYRDYGKKKFDAPSVPQPDRDRLLSKLGWYGRLALTPPQAPDQVSRRQVLKSPLRFVYGLVGIVLLMAVLAVIGLIGLIAFFIGSMMGGVKLGLRESSGSSGVYAETFAIWMLLFFGGLITIEHWPRPQDRFLLNLVVMFGSLAVLLWPVVRGISWSQVRSDIGLTRGRAGILEPLVGIPSYAMMLPMLAVGFCLTLVILLTSMELAAGQGGPAPSPFEPKEMLSHPIVHVVLQGGFWLRLQLLLLACVAAPIVEETMFRGVLYRHLRDATSGMGWVASFIFSGLWASFIFAIIHPQGPVAVPALMGIALGCTLAREWRDSLWASMVVHSISNSLIFTMLLLGASR